ncbi:MAG: carbohydrate kinase family protein, partial [Puniceicoccaceae bacterium]
MWPGREPVQRRLARAAAELEPRLWVVTDGPRPVWYAVRGDRPRSHRPPSTEEVSPTGSGDVFLAGL